MLVLEEQPVPITSQGCTVLRPSDRLDLLLVRHRIGWSVVVDPAVLRADRGHGVGAEVQGVPGMKRERRVPPNLVEGVDVVHVEAETLGDDSPDVIGSDDVRDRPAGIVRNCLTGRVLSRTLVRRDAQTLPAE